MDDSNRNKRTYLASMIDEKESENRFGCLMTLEQAAANGNVYYLVITYFFYQVH